MVIQLPTRQLGKNGPQVSALGFGLMVSTKSLEEGPEGVGSDLLIELGTECFLWRFPV